VAKVTDRKSEGPKQGVSSERDHHPLMQVTLNLDDVSFLHFVFIVDAYDDDSGVWENPLPDETCATRVQNSCYEQDALWAEADPKAGVADVFRLTDRITQDYFQYSSEEVW